MNKIKTFKIIKNLLSDTKTTVFEQGEFVIFLLRPSKVPKRFISYDPSKNFQIWLQEGNRIFRPNHLRVFIDLNLRARCRPDLKQELLVAFDGVFYKHDPLEIFKRLETAKFDHFLNPLVVTGKLAQLMIIEQEYCYYRESKFDPKSLFLQGWIRQFIDSPKEMDNMCMSVCRGQPPATKYTARENIKHKEYENQLSPLWYLEK